MSTKAKYQLFISTKCSCCNKIIAYLENKKIIIPITNIDTEEYDLPFKLMILPALVKEKKLLGYGCDDIIYHLERA